MLSVIVDTAGAEDRLAGLLAALTPAAVEGLVREVLVVDAARTDLVAAEIDLLCGDMGAEVAGDLASAVAVAKSDWLLVLPAEIRFRDGWVERLARHLAGGPRDAVIGGEKSGLFARRPTGLLIGKAVAASVPDPDLKALRRRLDAGAVRLD